MNGEIASSGEHSKKKKMSDKGKRRAKDSNTEVHELVAFDSMDLDFNEAYASRSQQVESGIRRESVKQPKPQAIKYNGPKGIHTKPMSAATNTGQDTHGV